MNKSIAKASITIAATLTSGAVAYAVRTDASMVFAFVGLLAVIFGGLALAADGV